MSQFYEICMLCDVAALPFQEHANYGTWSIHFGWKTLSCNAMIGYFKYLYPDWLIKLQSSLFHLVIHSFKSELQGNA